MSTLRILSLLVAVAFLAACEDPSNVGIGLVGETGGEPVHVDVEAATVEATSVRETTGGTNRVLAGTADDPAFGTLAARAYLDFAAVSGMDSDFQSGQVTAAELVLSRNYVYGDTTAPVTLRLHDLAAAFDDAGARADTTIPPGAFIAEYTFNPTDTLVVLPLPAAWVAANDTTLRSSTFSASFHGFTLQPAAPGAVVGFDVENVRLRLVESGDTLGLPVSDRLTTLARSDAAALPAGRLLVQDGVGPTLRFGFPFTDGTVDAAAVNRAVVRVAADTTALAAFTPVGFYRPPIETLTLFGVTADSLYTPLSNAVRRGTDGIFRFSSTELASVVQHMLIDDSPIDHFELGIPNALPTLNVLVVYAAATDRPPQAELTVTPITR